MEEFCRKIAFLLFYQDIVDKDEIKDVHFVIELVLTQVITFITIMMIGLLYLDIIDLIIICTSFVIGRIYLGGYHAKSFIGCYFLTIFSFIVAIMMPKIIPIIEFFYVIGVLLSLCLYSGYKYNKIIVFNIFYLLLMIIFHKNNIYQINMVNYFIIVLMRALNWKELDER